MKKNSNLSRDEKSDQTRRRYLKRFGIATGVLNLGLTTPVVATSTGVESKSEDTVHFIEYSLRYISEEKQKNPNAEDVQIEAPSEEIVEIDIPPLHYISDGEISPTRWAPNEHITQLRENSKVVWSYARPRTYRGFDDTGPAGANNYVIPSSTISDLRPVLGVKTQQRRPGPQITVRKANNGDISLKFGEKEETVKANEEKKIQQQSMSVETSRSQVRKAVVPELIARNHGELRIVSEGAADPNGGE